MNSRSLQLLQLLARQGLIHSPAHTRNLEGATPVALTRFFTTSSPWLSQAQPQREPRPEEESGASSSSQQAGSEGASSTGSSSSSTGGVNPEELKQKVFSAFKSGFSNARSNLAGDAGPGALHAWVNEVQDVFKPADRNIRSATRLYTGPVMEFKEGDTTTSALQIIKRQETTWDKVREKLSSVPFLNRLHAFKVTDTSAFKKGQEVIEDLKEKYETSDHPMVHKVDEMKERVLSGNEGSRANLEIRTRDPSFDLNYFVRAIKHDAPVVVRALLRRDMDTLSLHLGPEMMERLGGIFKHEAERGFEDPTILFVSDVEVVEMRLMDGDPFLVAQFHCQQLKCVRDKFGNVVDGSPDSIQRVYYFWGLQQEKQGVVTADGQLLPPRWVIRDMMWQSMLALV